MRAEERLCVGGDLGGVPETAPLASGVTVCELLCALRRGATFSGRLQAP